MTDEAFPWISDVSADSSSERPVPEDRFFPPWTIETRRESFVIRDAKCRPLGYVYFVEPHQQCSATLLTRDEAWRIAAYIAKLPDIMKRAR
jgi:hypothetical protein